jgi:hypothetical protein
MAWEFGTWFLGGYVLPLALGSIFPHVREEDPKYTIHHEQETLELTEKTTSCKDEECSHGPHDHHDTSYVSLNFANVSWS